jgi:transposase
MELTNKKLKKILQMLDIEIIKYKQSINKKKRDWRTYEQQVVKRLETAFDELQPLVYDAVNSIKLIHKETRGVKSKLTLEQKVIILLLKHIFEKSNRTMSAMFILFSWLTNVKVSYKTVERLYSDELIQIALNNLHKFIIDKKGLEEAELSGDGTGYSLTIRKHYASYAQKLKDKAKKITNKKRKNKKKQFLYSFALMDIDSRMYLAYGSSFKSEKEAYKDALLMLKESNIKINSIRLDKYFSNQQDVEILSEEYKEIKCYLIPKSDATIKGKKAWKEMLKEFILNTQEYLGQYYKRNQSESGFAEDKRRTGWKLGQKRFDRIHTANTLTYIWHNLWWLAD